MSIEITDALLAALDRAGTVNPGETMVGRLEVRLPETQDAALDALATAMTGDKSKRSIAGREVLARGFRALREDYARQLAAQA